MKLAAIAIEEKKIPSYTAKELIQKNSLNLCILTCRMNPNTKST